MRPQELETVNFLVANNLESLVCLFAFKYFCVCLSNCLCLCLADHKLSLTIIIKNRKWKITTENKSKDYTKENESGKIKKILKNSSKKRVDNKEKSRQQGK